MTNVFEFPKNKIVREVLPPIEEIEAAKEKGRQNYADDIVVDFIENALSLLENYGIDTEGDTFTKDFSFAVEAVRATIYRSMAVDHHLHEFIEKSVTVIKRGEDGEFKMDLPENSNEMDLIISSADDALRLDDQE